jgi:O-antigen/teichoic acid export membrane protein
MRSQAIWSLFTGGFASGVAKLASGQGLAMAIPILAAPVLGRLYSPADYGLLGVFMGICTIFGAIGNWQYAQAIVVQKSERISHILLGVAVAATTATTLASLAVAAAAALYFRGHPAFGELVGWVWLIPVITFCVGISSALASIANRRRDYGRMSAVAVASVVVSTAIAVILGYNGAGAAGLLTSYVLGSLLVFVLYAWFYADVLRSLPGVAPVALLALARRNLSFPRFSLPASVMRSVALSTPNFALAYMGATELAGHLTRAQSLLALPIGLIGMALAQVFQEKAARELTQEGACWRSYKKLLTVLSLASPLGFVVLAFFAPQLFVLYLGPQWVYTGYVAQMLAPMFCLRMISGPLWPVFSIYNANHQDYYVALAQFAATIAISAAIVAMALAPIMQIAAYAAVNSVVGFAIIVQTYRLVRAGSYGKTLVT